jgi:hypothetical protein
MSNNEPIEKNVPPFFIAGLAGLLCLPIIYVATRPLLWLSHAQWAEWLLLTLFILGPIVVTFMVLYVSAWHQELSRVRRMLSMIFSSCIIFGVDLLFLGFIIVVACVILGLGRVMGGN